MKLINFLVCIVIVGCCEGLSANKPRNHNRWRRDASDESDEEDQGSVCCGKEAPYPELPAECEGLQAPEESSDWEYELGDACSAQCEASHAGLWDGSRINKKAYIKEMKSLYPYDYAEESAAKHFKSCIQQAIKINDLLVKNKGPLNCSFVPQIMDFCMYREVELHCPDELRIETDICDRQREDMAAVDINYFKELAEN